MGGYKYYLVRCFARRGRKKVERRAMVPANSKSHALERMKISYPAPRYFGWDCSNTESPA